MIKDAVTCFLPLNINEIKQKISTASLSPKMTVLNQPTTQRTRTTSP